MFPLGIELLAILRRCALLRRMNILCLVAGHRYYIKKRLSSYSRVCHRLCEFGSDSLLNLLELETARLTAVHVVRGAIGR